MMGSRSGVITVAKKTPKPADGRESWNRKPLIANFRGSAEFKAWLAGLAAFDRQTLAGVVERALVNYARLINYPEPPPKR